MEFVKILVQLETLLESQIFQDTLPGIHVSMWQGRLVLGFHNYGQYRKEEEEVELLLMSSLQQCRSQQSANIIILITDMKAIYAC